VAASPVKYAATLDELADHYRRLLDALTATSRSALRILDTAIAMIPS